MRKALVVLLALVLAAVLSACSNPFAPESETVSDNLSKAADSFEVDRRIVFFNGITDTYLLTIEGKCSLTDQTTQLEVVCKTGPESYQKHFLGLSDNVSYFAEQSKPIGVDPFQTRIIFRPEAIVPDFDLQTSGG